MKAAMLEINHLEVSNGTEAFGPGGYQQGAIQLEKFRNAYFHAAKLARERFKRMSVVSR
jgi:hypothetical protein